MELVCEQGTWTAQVVPLVRQMVKRLGDVSSNLRLRHPKIDFRVAMGQGIEFPKLDIGAQDRLGETISEPISYV